QHAGAQVLRVRRVLERRAAWPHPVAVGAVRLDRELLRPGVLEHPERGTLEVVAEPVRLLRTAPRVVADLMVPDGGEHPQASVREPLGPLAVVEPAGAADLVVPLLLGA